MEKILCDVHGSVCMLKTGVKDGPNKGKSFYVCVDKQGCNFSQLASVSQSHCLSHEDSVVELQALTYVQQLQSYRLYYRCIIGKKEGQRWCGNVPWTTPDKEKRNPLSDKQLQPPSLPSIRNPFKAPDKTDKNSKLRDLLICGGDEKDSTASHKADEGERYQKANGETVDAGVKEEEEENLNSLGTYQGKLLPVGMKLKKRVTDEERNGRQANDAERMTSETKNKHTEQGEEGKTAVKQTDPTIKESASKFAPSSCADASIVSDNTRDPTANKPAQSESGHTKTPHDNDDVMIVSVKLATQKTPPVSAVQKTLTTFPGFQPASKVKCQQEDPQVLHSLLTAQLKQKKAAGCGYILQGGQGAANDLLCCGDHSQESLPVLCRGASMPHANCMLGHSPRTSDRRPATVFFSPDCFS